MKSSSSFPVSYLRDPSDLHGILAGDHALAANAVGHVAFNLALNYPTDIDEADRTHFVTASTVFGIDRPRVIAEAAASHASAIIARLSESASQYKPPTRQDFTTLGNALNEIYTDALAVQPVINTYESDPDNLSYERLRYEITVTGLTDRERDEWIESHALNLLAIGATHRDLLDQLVRLCTPAADKAQASALRKLGKADAEAHKRFKRAAGTTHIPFTAEVIELARSEVKLRQGGAADNLAADVLLRTGAAARASKTATAYLLAHRDEIAATLDELREGPPHLAFDNTIPTAAVLAQLPEPVDVSRELAAILYSAIAHQSSTPATVAKALFDAVTRELAQVKLDPVEAILHYLSEGAYDDDAVIARATDELITPSLAAHADKAAAVISGPLPNPTCFLIHTSPFSLPVAPGLFEQELRVTDPVLNDVVVVISLFPYRIDQLAFYSEAKSILDGPGSDRYYPNPARKPQRSVTRTHLNGSVPTAPTYDEELILPAN